MKRYHCALLAAVIVSIFLCRASCSCCVRNSPSGIPRTLASSLSSIRLCISGREMSALIAAFRQLIARSTMFKKRTIGRKHFQVRAWGGNGRVSVGRCSVIYKDNGLFWIQICPCLCHEIIETRCIHSANKSGGKHKSIDRRYCHCHSQVSSSLAANLVIGSLSLPRSTVTSGRPDVVAAFVYKHTVSHYGIVHKPCRVIDSLVQHIRSVSVSREGPCQFYSKQHPV